MDFLASIGQWLKAGHLVFVVAWMAAMMYLPRLFIYHYKADTGSELSETLKVMERRLAKGIMTPSMLAVWIFAVLLVIVNPSVFSAIWFYVKLIAVIAMTAIHGFYTASLKKFAVDQRPKTEKFWRIINECPFILLIIILIMVLVKPFA